MFFPIFFLWDGYPREKPPNLCGIFVGFSNTETDRLGIHNPKKRIQPPPTAKCGLTTKICVFTCRHVDLTSLTVKNVVFVEIQSHFHLAKSTHFLRGTHCSVGGPKWSQGLHGCKSGHKQSNVHIDQQGHHDPEHIHGVARRPNGSAGQ